MFSKNNRKILLFDFLEQDHTNSSLTFMNPVLTVSLVLRSWVFCIKSFYSGVSGDDLVSVGQPRPITVCVGDSVMSSRSGSGHTGSIKSETHVRPVRSD